MSQPNNFCNCRNLTDELHMSSPRELIHIKTFISSFVPRVNDENALKFSVTWLLFGKATCKCSPVRPWISLYPHYNCYLTDEIATKFSVLLVQCRECYEKEKKPVDGQKDFNAHCTRMPHHNQLICTLMSTSRFDKNFSAVFQEAYYTSMFKNESVD